MKSTFEVIRKRNTFPPHRTSGSRNLYIYRSKQARAAYSSNNPTSDELKALLSRITQMTNYVKKDREGQIGHVGIAVRDIVHKLIRERGERSGEGG